MTQEDYERRMAALLAQHGDVSRERFEFERCVLDAARCIAQNGPDDWRSRQAIQYVRFWSLQLTRGLAGLDIAAMSAL